MSDPVADDASLSPLPFRQLNTKPPRMVIGNDYSRTQRMAVVKAFNQATLDMVKDFARRRPNAGNADFSDATVREHLPVISFRCSDDFAAALTAAKLPGVGKFMQLGGLELIRPVAYTKIPRKDIKP